MLEGVPRRLSAFRESPVGMLLPWGIAAGAIALDLTSLRESPDQRVIIVVALSAGTLFVYATIRLLIGRGIASERVHDVSVQLAGFLMLFLGIAAIFTLARAMTDRAVAATLAVFNGSWALGALDGYRRGGRRVGSTEQASQ